LVVSDLLDHAVERAIGEHKDVLFTHVISFKYRPGSWQLRP
jgi:hypothetical protein